MDAELVNRIVKEVLQALGQAPGSPSAPGARGPAAAPPPAAPAAPGSKTATVAPRQRGARVFLTADAIRQRLAGASDKRTVELAWNEVLTPNAEDFAQQLHLAVKKMHASSRVAGAGAEPPSAAPRSLGDPPSSAGAGGSESLPVGLLLHRADDKVTGLVEGLAREGLRLADFARTDCVLRNLESLGEAIRAGQVARGVVVAPHAAGLMALAAKCKGVRPVQGTRQASVEAGLRQFAANVLIVEHAFHTFHEMRAMIRSFVAAPDRLPADKRLADAMARLDQG